MKINLQAKTVTYPKSLHFCGKEMLQSLLAWLACRSSVAQLTRSWVHLRKNNRTFLNTLRPRQNSRHFADNISNCNLLKENIWIYIIVLMKFVPWGSIDNMPDFGRIMACRRQTSDCLITAHNCGTRPRWFNTLLSVRLWVNMACSSLLNTSVCW